MRRTRKPKNHRVFISRYGEGVIYACIASEQLRSLSTSHVFNETFSKLKLKRTEDHRMKNHRMQIDLQTTSPDTKAELPARRKQIRVQSNYITCEITIHTPLGQSAIRICIKPLTNVLEVWIVLPEQDHLTNRHGDLHRRSQSETTAFPVDMNADTLSGVSKSVLFRICQASLRAYTING